MPLPKAEVDDKFDEKLGVALRFKVTMSGANTPDHNLKYWTTVSGIDQKFDVVTYQSGDSVNWKTQVPGQMKWSNVTLTRAVTHDDTKATLKWLETFSHKHEKKGTMKIEGFTAWGDKAGIWKFTGVWPVEWDGPSFDTGSAKAAIEKLVVAHDGLLNTAEKHHE